MLTSKTGRLHDKNRFTRRLYVSASGTKVKMSPSFHFRGKDLSFQINAFWPKLCTKNTNETVQTNSQTTEISRNAFNNIFGQYTSNCSNSRTVLHSEQIVNKSPVRSGILSEHEQVNSYSHSKNNFLVFVIDSVNTTVSLLEKKTVRNNSEGQFTVTCRSESDLYSKPVSVCGHVFSYMPSTKASSLVLQ